MCIFAWSLDDDDDDDGTIWDGDGVAVYSTTHGHHCRVYSEMP